MHVKQADGKYHYGPDWQHGGTPVKFGYSLMGTGTALMHRTYLEMYHDPEILPKGMIEYINQVRNCEDIGMNVMVTKFLEDVSWTQCSALSVVAHGKIKNLQADARKHASQFSHAGCSELCFVVRDEAIMLKNSPFMLC